LKEAEFQTTMVNWEKYLVITPKTNLEIALFNILKNDTGGKINAFFDTYEGNPAIFMEF
jgi:hypothetical protein